MAAIAHLAIMTGRNHTRPGSPEQPEPTGVPGDGAKDGNAAGDRGDAVASMAQTMPADSHDPVFTRRSSRRFGRKFPPAQIDEYRVGALLGRGGMGTVYCAHDVLLDRAVAIKFINQPDAVRAERFFVEARAMARFTHPNIAAIYRIGEYQTGVDRSWPFIVYEYVKGLSLDAYDAPMPWQQAAAIARDLARGLAAAHRRGVLHRDIKPANAVIADDTGQAKLLDFGLAKLRDRVADHASETSSLPSGARAPSDPAPVGDGSPSMRRAHGPVGTPYYIAPEVWRDGADAASERSDVYSFGAMLYELCAGIPPHGMVPKSQLPVIASAQDPPELSSMEPDVDIGLEVIVARCLARDPGARYASGEAVRDALEELLAGHRVVGADGGSSPGHPGGRDGNPYRGLLPFDSAHRALFFGRQAETNEVIERLRSDPLVLVAGESGVGKSSLVLAGVVPRVADSGLGDGRQWSTMPMVPGRWPYATLVALIAERLDVREERLIEELEFEPSVAGRWLREFHGRRRGTVLLIDQLEELVTVSDDEQAEDAARLLASLSGRIPGLRILATVRGDHLARLSHLPALGGLIERAIYLLRPLDEDGIRETIVGPAKAAGIGFESNQLVDTLIASTVRAEGGLPLLQFALAELWNQRDPQREVIPDAALERIGGVEGALSRHADQVLAAMLPGTHAAARRVLLRLVTSHGTRARWGAEELAGDDEAHGQALEALVEGRLLVAGRSEDGWSYEIAHEALARDWSTLRQWLDKEGGLRVVKERLSGAAAAWDRVGRERDALWRGAQLREADDIASDVLPATDAAFLEASRRAAKWGRRLRRIALVGVIVVIGLGYGGYLHKERKAREQRAREVAAIVDGHVAEATKRLDRARERRREVERVRRDSFAAYVANERDAGDVMWRQALAVDRGVDRAYARVSRSLERALERDPVRGDVRSLLAQALFERAVLADRRRRGAARDELLERLEVYDDGGGFMARWNAPIPVLVRISPAGERMVLYHSVDDGQGVMSWELVGEFSGGRREWSLDPGSYLVVVPATATTAEVRFPFRVKRGIAVAGSASSATTGALVIDVSLPAATAVPPGFVYIPAGSFVFGFGRSDAREIQRTWYQTSPAHRRRTGPYLIAIHETTYGEWMDYLRALPAAERARRLPAASAQGLRVELVATGDDFAVRMELLASEIRARSGEPFRYRDAKARPDSRREQDWRRFPVTGISKRDAMAFARWLDGSGRVPGARLCREDEWERAARGADERVYPHGDRLLPTHGNFDETYARESFGPDEVGSHDSSVSPFGLLDMTGNAYEMTLSIWKDSELVLRGGSYFHGLQDAVVVNRVEVGEDLRDPRLGFRICATPAR